MALHREFGNADNDHGTWGDWKKDPETKRMVRTKVRGIPASVEEKMKREVNQEKLTLRNKSGSDYTETDIDLERSRRLIRNRAAFALLDTEGYEVFVGDPEAAAVYTEILGKHVEPESTLKLDGLWNPRLRAHVLHEHSDFAVHVVKRVDGDEEEARANEEQLSGN